MKRLFLCAAFLLTILASSSAWPSAFTVTDTYYEISGSLTSPYGFSSDPYPDGTVLQSFNLASTQQAISYAIVDTEYPPKVAGAAPSSVSASANEASVSLFLYVLGNVTPVPSGGVISRVDFSPTFNGYAPELITFDGEQSLSRPRANWKIMDLTSGETILNWSPYLSLIQPAVQWLGGGDPYNYDSWNSSHTYESVMMIGPFSADKNYESPWMYTNLFSVGLPEPLSLILLGAGFLGVIGLKLQARRIRRSR